MRPYQPSPYQVGAMPQREVSGRTALMSVVLFFALLACLAFVSPEESATCSTPVTVASK
jgi:hypothetical protein